MSSEISACIFIRGGAPSLARIAEMVLPHVAELVVLHDSSVTIDGVTDNAPESGCIRLFPEQWSGALAARNRFFHLVSYPILLILEEDMYLPPSFFRKLPAYISLLNQTDYSAVRLPRYRWSNGPSALTDEPAKPELSTCGLPQDTLIHWRVNAQGIGWRNETVSMQNLALPAEQVFTDQQPVIVDTARYALADATPMALPHMMTRVRPQRPDGARLAVSLLVHEAMDVVIEQLANLRYYLDDPMIIVHTSLDFTAQPDYNEKRLRDIPGVHVNPEHLETGWAQTSLTLAHAGNFKLALSIGGFDYLVMNASNDMYVRHGAAEYMSRFEAGVQQDPLPINESPFSRSARTDEGLWQLRCHLGGVPAYVAGHEGAFFHRDLVEEMTPLIDRYARAEIKPWRGAGAVDGDYGKEEYYFSTAAAALASSIGKPVIYRDFVHQPSVPRADVLAVRDARAEALPLYIGGEPFGVKRIARTLDDPVRTLIRSFDDWYQGRASQRVEDVKL